MFLRSSGVGWTSWVVGVSENVGFSLSGMVDLGSFFLLLSVFTWIFFWWRPVSDVSRGGTSTPSHTNDGILCVWGEREVTPTHQHTNKQPTHTLITHLSHFLFVPNTPPTNTLSSGSINPFVVWILSTFITFPQSIHLSIHPSICPSIHLSTPHNNRG